MDLRLPLELRVPVDIGGFRLLRGGRGVREHPVETAVDSGLDRHVPARVGLVAAAVGGLGELADGQRRNAEIADDLPQETAEVVEVLDQRHIDLVDARDAAQVLVLHDLRAGHLLHALHAVATGLGHRRTHANDHDAGVGTLGRIRLLDRAVQRGIGGVSAAGVDRDVLTVAVVGVARLVQVESRRIAVGDEDDDLRRLRLRPGLVHSSVPIGPLVRIGRRRLGVVLGVCPGPTVVLVDR